MLNIIFIVIIFLFIFVLFNVIYSLVKKQKGVKNFIIEIKLYLKKQNKKSYEKNELAFIQAGLNPFYATKILIFFRLGGAFIFLMLGLSLIFVFPNLDKLPVFIKLTFLLLCIFMGYSMFDYWLSYKVNARVKTFMFDFPYILDLVEICARSGINLNESFKRAADESYMYNKALSKELKILVFELQTLQERKMAFYNFKNRNPVPLIEALATAIIQSEEQGTSIINTLQNLSDEYHNRKLSQISNRISRLPTILLLPLVLFLLPSLLIILFTPPAITFFGEFDIQPIGYR